MKTGKPASQGGFTYFGLLLAIATVALGAGAGAGMLSNDIRRDKELELLLAGDEIRRAIESYHAKNNGGQNPYPKQLEWLIRDPNQPTILRHLRKIFRDPMHDPDETENLRISGTWALIYGPGEQIIGVHSNSRGAPLKKTGFPKSYESFAQAKSYSDWRFMAAGTVAATPQANTQPKNFVPTPLAPGAPLVPGGGAATGGGAFGQSGAVAPAVVPPPPPPPPPPASPQEAPPAPPEPAPAAVAVAPQAPAQPPAGAPAPASSAAPQAPAAPPAPAAPQAAEPAPFGSAPQPFILRAPKDF